MEKITITDENGVVKEANLVTFLSLPQFSSMYLAYMENELKDTDNEILFAKIIEEDGNMCLGTIESIEEKAALRAEFERKLGEK